MKTLKVLLQEVVSGIKAWVNSNFAQESNTVHKTGNETVNGVKTFNNLSLHINSESYYKNTNFSGKLTPETTVQVTTATVANSNAWYGNQAYIWDVNGECYWRWNCGSFLGTTQAQGVWGLDYGVSRDFSSLFFRPQFNNSHNLGDSDHQWKSVHSQNYYYKGTAWGLDKANFWTNTNKFYGITITGHSGIRWLRDGYTAGTLPETTMYYGFQNAYDSNEDVFGRIRSFVSTTGTNMREHYKYAWGDLSKYIHKGFWISNDGSDSEQSFLVNRVIPETDNATDLGTSTNRWKTLNGLNPGVLSLPDLSDPDPINTSTWVTDTPTNNAYTPSEDGWLNVVASNSSTQQFSCYIKSGDFYVSNYTALGDIDDNIWKSGLFVPVLAGQTYYIVFKGNVTLTVDATFYPAKGNV